MITNQHLIVDFLLFVQVARVFEYLCFLSEFELNCFEPCNNILQLKFIIRYAKLDENTFNSIVTEILLRMTFEIRFVFVENRFKRQALSDNVAVKTAFWNICISNSPFRFKNKLQMHWLRLENNNSYDSYDMSHMGHIQMNFKPCRVGTVVPDKNFRYFPKNHQFCLSIWLFVRRPP